MNIVVDAEYLSDDRKVDSRKIDECISEIDIGEADRKCELHCIVGISHLCVGIVFEDVKSLHIGLKVENYMAMIQKVKT